MGNDKPIPDSSECSSCKKVENQCKICLQEVKKKTGIQCQGPCLAWVHFECLNYTPGKIADVLKGLICVSCPCPDCKSVAAKEFLKVEPFTCNNVMCPANNPPSCDAEDCQANEVSRNNPPRCPPPGTLRTCGQRLCRTYGVDNPLPPPINNCPDKIKAGVGGKAQGKEACTQNPENCCVSPKGGMPNQFSPGMQNQFSPGMQNQFSPGMQNQLPPQAMQNMCTTVGALAQQLNELMASLNGLRAACPGGASGPGGAWGGPVGPWGALGPGAGVPMIGHPMMGPGGQPMKGCGSSGTSCAGKSGCSKCSGGPPPGGGGGGKAGLKKKGCTGGCGQAGQSGCAQPCHCPGTPIQKHR